MVDLRGPGTGTSDSILARLSAGESVITAAATRFWGTDTLKAINAMMMPPAFAPLAPAVAGAGSPSGRVAVDLGLLGNSYGVEADPKTAAALLRDLNRQKATQISRKSRSMR